MTFSTFHAGSTKQLSSLALDLMEKIKLHYRETFAVDGATGIEIEAEDLMLERPCQMF